jgi:hypothetical protein
MVIGWSRMGDLTIWLSPPAAKYTNRMRHRFDRLVHMYSISSNGNSPHRLCWCGGENSETLVSNSTLTSLNILKISNIFNLINFDTFIVSFHVPCRGQFGSSPVRSPPVRRNGPLLFSLTTYYFFF